MHILLSKLKKNRPHQTSEEFLPNCFSQAIMLIRIHSLFCLVPFAVFLLIYCSPKNSNCNFEMLNTFSQLQMSMYLCNESANMYVHIWD